MMEKAATAACLKHCTQGSETSNAVAPVDIPAAVSTAFLVVDPATSTAATGFGAWTRPAAHGTSPPPLRPEPAAQDLARLRCRRASARDRAPFCCVPSGIGGHLARSHLIVSVKRQRVACASPTAARIGRVSVCGLRRGDRRRPGTAVARRGAALAEARSPQLAGAEYAATAARERGIASSQLPDPVLRLGLDNVPVNGADAWSLTDGFHDDAPHRRHAGIPRLREARPAPAARRRRSRTRIGEARRCARGAAPGSRAGVARPLFRAADCRAVASAGRRSCDCRRQRWKPASRPGAAMRPTCAPRRRCIVQSEDQIAASEQQARISAQMLSRWLGASANRVAGPTAGHGVGRLRPRRNRRAGSACASCVVLQQDTLLARDGIEARRAQQDAGLERRGRLPAARPGVLEHGLDRRQYPAAAVSRASARIAASPRARRRLAQAETLFEDTLRQHQAELRAKLRGMAQPAARAQSLQRTCCRSRKTGSHRRSPATRAAPPRWPRCWKRGAPPWTRACRCFCWSATRRAPGRRSIFSCRRSEPCASIRRQAMKRTNECGSERLRLALFAGAGIGHWVGVRRDERGQRLPRRHAMQPPAATSRTAAAAQSPRKVSVLA